MKNKSVSLFRFFPLFVLVMLLGLLLATVACAAEAVQSAPQALSATLQQTVFPVVTSFVLGLLGILLKKLGTKWHIDALTQQNNILIQVAGQAVAYAEEKASALIGSRAALTGSQKLDTAVTYICQALPKVTPEQAERAATAALAMIPGVGATGGAAVAFANGQSDTPAASPISYQLPTVGVQFTASAPLTPAGGEASAPAGAL